MLHDTGHVLGPNQSRTLQLAEDDRGLAIEMDVAETHIANDALVSIRRGDVDDMSFGFIAIEDGWTLGAEVIRVESKASLELLCRGVLGAADGVPRRLRPLIRLKTKLTGLMAGERWVRRTV